MMLTQIMIVRAMVLMAVVCLAVGLLSSCSDVAVSSGPGPYGSETKEQREQRMAWWHEAKFGMFIHWGVYSVPAGTYDGKRIAGIGEWIMNQGKIPVERYQEYAKEFNPSNYDADLWVRLAKEAGMKYIVITSKHHDGFAMFHSKVSNWNIVDATPFDRDPLKELSKACKKHGLKLGFYYSQAQDWCHPGGAAAGGHWDKAQDGDMSEYIRNIAVPQVKEILSNYGDIAVLWWDTPVDMNNELADMLIPLVDLQRGILVNNRLGGGYEGDFGTPEQYIPSGGMAGRDWETCMTMNDTWGFKSYDDNWKSTRTLIRNLVDIVSKGGNYLLNVGPTSLGEIPQPSIARLKEIGKWMDTNGQSIYGTTASPFHKLSWGRCTKKVHKKGTTLYLHVFDWPTNGKLEVTGLKNEVRKAYLLADPKQGKLKASCEEDGVVVSVPGIVVDPIDSVVVLEIAGEPEVEAQMVRQQEDGNVVLTASEAEVVGGQVRYEQGGGKDNIGYWSNNEDFVKWTMKVTKPGKFTVDVTYANPDEGGEYEVALGEQKLPGKVHATNNWVNFTTETIGSLQISQAGKYELTVKPKKIAGGALMNLKAVTLKANSSE